MFLTFSRSVATSRETSGGGMMTSGTLAIATRWWRPVATVSIARPPFRYRRDGDRDRLQDERFTGRDPPSIGGRGQGGYVPAKHDFGEHGAPFSLFTDTHPTRSFELCRVFTSLPVVFVSSAASHRVCCAVVCQRISLRRGSLTSTHLDTGLGRAHFWERAASVRRTDQTRPILSNHNNAPFERKVPVVEEGFMGLGGDSFGAPRSTMEFNFAGPK
eukprot:144742-Pyramimonas_sp.AAC.1